MALNTIKFLDTFQKELYPSNAFYNGAKNDSAFANNLTISIPNYQAEVSLFDMGTAAGSYPRGLNELAHAEKTYTMTQYGVEPYMVDPVELNEFAYDKRKAVLEQAVNALNSQVGYKIAWEWTTDETSSVFDTSGTATRANRFGNTVKRITYADLLKLQTYLNNQDVPVEGRRLLVDAYGLSDIQVMSELQGSEALTSKAFTDGAIMRVAGFDVFMRSKVASFTSAGAKKAIDAADVATDLSSAVAYHPNMVRYAVGTKENKGIKVFIGEEDPQIYGVAMSAYTRVGAAPSYEPVANTVKGVATLIEAV